MSEAVLAVLCFLAGWIIKLAKDAACNRRWLNDLTHEFRDFKGETRKALERIEDEIRSLRRSLLGR